MNMEEASKILFDGFYQGGANGEPKVRQGKKKPVLWEYANDNFAYVLGKIKSNVIMIDYDNIESFECRLKIARETQEHCIVIKSAHKGGHFYFFNNTRQIYKSNTGNKTVLTFKPVDYKCGIKMSRNGEMLLSDNYACLSTDRKNEYREIVYANLTDDNGLDEVPFYDLSISSTAEKHSFLNMSDGDGRQDGLFTYMNPVQANGFTYEQYCIAADLINNYVFAEPLPMTDFESATRREAWENINTELSQCFEKNRFLHYKFADYMIRRYHIKRINGDLHIYKNGVYVPGKDEIESSMIEEIEVLTDKQRQETIKTIRLKCKGVEPCSPNYIAFRNGIYDIDSNELHPFSPDVIITNQIPWDYNPKAYSGVIDSFLDELSCSDGDVRHLLEECAGACLYRSNKLGGGKMIILSGDKSNGKSTFIEVLQSMIGVKNYSSLDMKEVGERFTTSVLFGKLANLGDDISHKFYSDTAILKKIITGNSIKAENKGEKPFEFVPYCTMIFSANEIPRTKDDTGALLRRMSIIPFNAHFSNDDPDYNPNMSEDLKTPECMEYLILLALDGLWEVIENKKFTVPESVSNALKEYEKMNNPVISFIEECADSDYIITGQTTNDVYGRYQGYCFNNGYEPYSKTKFSRQLKLLGYDTGYKHISNKTVKIYIK